MLANALLIINLFILESLLSIDNAAVLALLVKGLPAPQQPKALRYGILGAFFFRGLALLMASFLIHIIWLKILGGAYLFYLTWKHFNLRADEPGAEVHAENILQHHIGAFWSTVVLVEIMDMAFSIDNIFAAVAMTKNLYLILTGVFLGIIAMRFIAAWFAKLLIRYPRLEHSAFVVIGLLGGRLIIEGLIDYLPDTHENIFNYKYFDFIFSGALLFIFFIPFFIKPSKRKSRDTVLNLFLYWSFFIFVLAAIIFIILY